MSDTLGKIALSSSSESFLGEYEGARNYSEETARLIDTEVKAILDTQYARIRALLASKRTELETVVKVLLERETLHADEFDLVMRGQPIPEPEAPPRVAPAPSAHAEKPLTLPPGMMPKPG